MSGRHRGATSLTACGAWLHDRMAEWVDAKCVVDVDAALATVVQKINDVLAYATRCEAIAVRDALDLQCSGQHTWNSTFLLNWPPERAALKRRGRQLAALLFLCSHHVFAPAEVVSAYMAHHIDDAEKCVLMCLKVSKMLVRSREVAEAQQMLTWATEVVNAAPNPSQVRVRQWSIEVRFAQLHLFWQTGLGEETCAVAEQLASSTSDSMTYREALVEFIYTAALDAATTSEAGVTPAPREATLQALLSLSLRLQAADNVGSTKQLKLMGLTQLQQSCSYLRSGDYAQAAATAATAYAFLETCEPLVVRLRAESLLHNTDEVDSALRAICAHGGVSVAELVALASSVVEGNPVLEGSVTSLLTDRLLSSKVTAEERKENVFRFTCYLLHVRSESSIGKLLDFVECAEYAVAPTFHRFLFCALWRLAAAAPPCTADDGVEHEAAAPTLSPLSQWQCLRVALTHFAPQQSSPAERQTVLLAMTQLLLTSDTMLPTCLTTNTHEGSTEERALVEAAQITWDLWAKEEGEETPHLLAQEAAALLAQAQLAFVLGRRDEALQRVQCVCETEKKDTSPAALPAAVHACSSLLNALLTRSCYEDAAAVAQLCLSSLASLSPQCTMDFAKVCAFGFLAQKDGDTTWLYNVADLLEAHVCPLCDSVPSAVATVTDSNAASWWSRLLWYVSDGLAETRLAQAVRLSFSAAVLHVLCVPAETELLRGRLSVLLEMEVGLFAEGQPALSTTETQRALSFLMEIRDVDGEESSTSLTLLPRQAVVQCLALMEVALRAVEEAGEYTEGNGIDTSQIASLSELPAVKVQDLERAAAACHRVASGLVSAPAALHHAAVSLEIAAAELHCRRAALDADTAELCAALSLLYAAYTFANNVELRTMVFTSLMALLRDTALPLAEVLSSVLQRRALDNSPQSFRTARVVEVTVEFFAIEAWNESVQWNVLRRREEGGMWRAWALSLADLLDASNASKAAINDYASQMPLL